MELFERIKENAINTISSFSESPGACIFLSCFFAFTSIFIIRGIVHGLMGMHRSSTQLKKLLKKYSFWEKAIMKHCWRECLHAKAFCRALIICHHFRVLFLFAALLLLLTSPVFELIISNIAGVICISVDIPLILLHVILDRYPFKRLKHEYRFKKYHNTDNRNRLI